MRRRSRDDSPPRDLACRVLGGGLALLSYTPTRRALLTEAETEVALAVIRGLSNAAIARERVAAVRTVANQVAAIMKKLGVSSRVELVTAFSVADLG